MKRFSTFKILLYTGIFFLVIGAIEIPFGHRDSNSIVIGTIYICTAIICQTIVVNSVPFNVTTTIKKEVIDLLEWSDSNIPESNHPDLCKDFVDEFRKRFAAAKLTENKNADTV